MIADNAIWGAINGIRPAKVAARILNSGKNETQTVEILINDFGVKPDRARKCVFTAKKAVKLKSTLNPKEVGLYVGIPFCTTRCAYCSFVSNNVDRCLKLVEPFTETLIEEINTILSAAKEQGLKIISIYIGGGTPTALPDAYLEKILLTLQKMIDFTQLHEYTIEAGRPDTITKSNLKLIEKYGATRICVNPQTMSDEVLITIGRRHTAKDVSDAVSIINRTNLLLNMDIIAGLPGDTVEGFKATLDSVAALEPANITVHTLSLKKGSKIMVDNIEVPAGAEVGEMLDYASEALTSKGYEPYYIYRQSYISGGFENIGWSKPGKECLYNICMMEELCTVIAVGGGGVTKLVTDDMTKIEREFNAKYPLEYIERKDKIEKKIKTIKNFYLHSCPPTESL